MIHFCYEEYTWLVVLVGHAKEAWMYVAHLAHRVRAKLTKKRMECDCDES